MSYTAAVYRLFIASPTDVALERRVVLEVIYDWNAVHSADLGVVILPVMWETHAIPEMGDRPQAIINRQLVETCDVLVGVFWTRIGSETGVAESGTVEEIRQFIDSEKPTLLYFSSKPVIPDSVDPEQYKRLQNFKQDASNSGLIDSFSSDADLRRKVYAHLVGTVSKLHRATINPQTSDVPAILPGQVDEMQARADSEKRQMRASALEKLRMEYIFSHDGISPELMAGTALPPREWMDRRIRELDWEEIFR